MAERPKRFRLTPYVAPENELHEWVRSYLDQMLRPPAFAACYPAGHIKLTPAEAAKLARAGLRRGMPDWLIWYNDKSYGLELKRPGGKLSRGYLQRTARGGVVWRAGQEEVFPQLRAAGMTIAICDSQDSVIAALRAWGMPLLKST